MTRAGRVPKRATGAAHEYGVSQPSACRHEQASPAHGGRRVAALILWILAALQGCQGFDSAPHCSELPQGACPDSRGGSCKDQACTAIYTCTEHGWVLNAVCDRDGGVADTGKEAADGPWSCGDASVELEGATSGCDPNELTAPDCPVQAATGCAETACLTGCADFFLCKTEGWIAVAYCDEDTGALIWLDGS
jgi:hypothetical protein